MVDVARQTPERLRERVDRRLPGLLIEWRELPEVVAEIDTWDDGEALTYIEDWRFSEAQRRDIEHIAEKGILTPQQLEQLTELRQLVAEHKPTLDRLLGV